ncbi:hypothetical protein KQ51_00765 [Candidatus Izimaplasma bacterium HR1]|jgi:hypothetical protein|uniref:class I SAM-dependent methyltransferase n=1 Tax=Candidatus Izimoplasma sp. HR1 TaxID=1541959 RepID=UPI0004F6D7D8|nr:hypothetical protein KQ51_00765 [Candidatus Izimaplasma bacterium HR1]
MVKEISLCKICNSPTDELFDKQLKVTYDVCHKCDFISKQESFLLTPDEEQGRYATHKNDDEGNIGYMNMFNNLIDLHVRPLKKVKNILDFGSGPYPMLKKILDRDGYNVAIYDPFFSKDLAYQNNMYDLITTTEAIEHFVNPIKEIEHLLSLLNDQGYLVIMTNFRTMDVEGFTTWWYRRDPTHISFFNDNTFNYLKGRYNLIEISNNHKNIITLQKQ